jgi:NAD+ synthetase
MKIALVQINPAIGDFAGNSAKIIRYAEEAKAVGCSLAIFSELALCGYPPQDLLERRSFLDDHDSSLRKLVDRIQGIGVICGVLTRHTGSFGKPLHNSAILIENGAVRTTHKRLLPTYDVFDESRYFQPGADSHVVTFQNLRLGITICEDIFNDPDLTDSSIAASFEGPDHSRSLYQVNPVTDLLGPENDGVDVLINIAASPFHMGKPTAKQIFFSRFSKRLKTPLLYINQVGGQDSLVFDGQSLAFDSGGNLVARADAFAEDMVIVDSDTWKQCRLTDMQFEKNERVRGDLMSTFSLRGHGDADAAEIFAALVLGTRDYVAKCGFKQVIIGLSGGIDSALTAAIAVHALGKENVLGVALPSPYSSAGSVTDAQALAENLAMEFEIIPIDNIFQAHLQTLKPFFEGLPADLTEQNIQARIRGNVLMALANKFGRLLLSTGNKSEMAVGYCTLYGDMSGGLAVISDVPKVMVYRICRYLNGEREIIPWTTIDKPPSAELAPGQKDQDDLPPYDILDAILEAHLEEGLGMREIVARGYEAEVVADVIGRVRVNEHKRKQAPLGLKVTSKAFGYGRRYPIAQKYVETLSE